MSKDKVVFIGKLAKWGIKEEDRRCIIIPIDSLDNVRNKFDNENLKITLEKLKV